MGERFLQTLKAEPLRFTAAFLSVFIPSFLAVAMLGAPLIPSVSAEEGPSSSGTLVPLVSQELPLRVVISSVGIDARVSNPTNTAISVLDSALQSGAVRYPLSGTLGEQKTVFLFGHSSFLPVVHNTFYRTFNHLERVNIGDTIEVYGAHEKYQYRVISVAKADSSAVSVDIAASKQQLVLSTCDSFGSKSERFVVTADFVESHPLAN